MNFIKSFNELFEKKITVKRKYTETHPAKIISSNANVRNEVLNAVSDGKLTEEEFLGILSGLNAHSKWLTKNRKLFKVEEDKAGLKTYSLSEYGKKIKNALLSSVQINEALNVPHPNQGKKPVNIFVGRFQPFTLGHVKVFEQLYRENKLPVVVFIVRSERNKEKAPFSEDLQIAMFEKMKREYPFLEAAYVINNAAVDNIFATIRPAYEPILWGFGTDRKKAYDYMINKPDYREQLGVNPEFSGYEIKRGDEDISATKVREALMIDDENAFKKLTPKSIHDMFIPLKTALQPIQESIKTFNEFKNIK
jgi:cytidyltransferase-like protein